MSSLFNAAREGLFPYKCNCCSRCCKEKIIRVNPYDAARLASHFHMSTSRFLMTYTHGAGTVLRMPYGGNCIFRNLNGCSVHGSRPLVCRLYPLRRNVSDDGKETFTFLELEPECISLNGQKGTIADYLLDQEAEESIEAADRYAGLADKLLKALRAEVEGDALLTQLAADLCVVPDPNSPGSIPELLDMDRAIPLSFTRTNQKEPGSLKEKVKVHITVMEDRLIGSNGDKTAHIKALATHASALGYVAGINIDELFKEWKRPVSPVEAAYQRKPARIRLISRRGELHDRRF